MRTGLLKSISAFFLAGTLLTGCGGGGSSSPASNSNAAPAANSSGNEATLVVWTYSNSFKERVETYYGGKLGKSVEVVITPFADFQTKLKQSVTDPNTTPDVFISNRDYVRDWVVSNGASLNLSEAFPEDVASYVENTYKSVVDLASDDAGNVFGITSEYPVGMMYYNREICKVLFGTDDPVEIGERLNSEEKILAAHEQLQAQYNGSVKMYGTFYNVVNTYATSRTEPWVDENNVFTITKEMDHFLDWCKTLYDNGMLNSEAEDDVYYQGYKTNSFMIDFLPSWGFRSKVNPQLSADTDGYGSWGVTSPYVPYKRGGSFYFISSASKNKDAAWELIKYLCMDEEVLYDTTKSTLDLGPNKIVNQRLLDEHYQVEALGGQEIYQAYATETPIVEKAFEGLQTVTRYDGNILEFFRNVCLDYGNGKVTKDQAFTQLESQIKTAYPEITVEKAL